MKSARSRVSAGGSGHYGARCLLVFGLGLAIFLGLVGGSVASAQEVVSHSARREPGSEPTAADIASHNAWMMASSALVLCMTAPGLALYYGGLVRKKNVLSVMMQCMFLMALMTVLWALYGYSLAFGNGGPLNRFIGGTDYLFMKGVQRTWDTANQTPMTPMFSIGGKKQPITMYSHMFFEGMFFIVTPALMCGAFAERMKFRAMVLFSILWGTLVYCPLAHWVWGGGWLTFGPKGILGGALDFAGGTVVHVSSGISALVASILIGPRLGHGREPMPPHNLTYTAVGASMLWIGWFGFNAGSHLQSDELATSAFAVTHFAAAAGALGWVTFERLTRGKPTVLGVSSGLVAGLVCITPAAGFVQPMPALLMGASAGMVCYLACSRVKARLGYDDALDAFGVHAVGGSLGALLTGVFATRACHDIGDGKPLGLLEGGSVLSGQIAATAITLLFCSIASIVLLKLIDWTIGLRAAANEERQGLDITQHGEEGYIFL
jgi:Amt family ammonium transporter